MTACIVGWKHLPFGKRETDDLESMIVEVARGAIADAGIEAKDIDRIFVGNFNAGFSIRISPPRSCFRRTTHCASSRRPASRTPAPPAGLRCMRARRLAARQARLALVVGVEKMTEVPARCSAGNLLKASYSRRRRAQCGGFAGIFARIAQQYFQRYGDKSDALARIAAKNHKNGVANPYAQLRKDLGYEFCRTVSDKNPLVAPPLRRTDCSLVSDGAAAIVLADLDTALAMKKAVVFRAAEQVNDFLPMSGRDMTTLRGPRRGLAPGARRGAPRHRGSRAWWRPMTASPSPS